MIPWRWRAQLAALLGFLLACLAPSLAPAQVRVGLTAGSLVFRGASTPAAAGASGAVLRPHGSYALGAMASMQRGAWRIRLGVERSSPGAAATLDGGEVADRTVLGLWTAEPAVARRLFTTSEDAAAWLEAGASVHWWSPFSEDVRRKVGGMAALMWTQRATRHLDLAVRAHVSASPSPFVQSDLTAELKPTTLWRWGVTLELARRL